MSALVDLVNYAMFEDIYEIRRKNMLALQREANLDRKDFAEKVGVSYQLLSHYIGKTPTKRIGDVIARRAEASFGKPEGYLDQNADMLGVHSKVSKCGQQSLPLPNDTTAESIPMRSIPVVSWVQAGNWTRAEPIDGAEITEWLPWYPNCGKNGFALIVSGESMQPKFEPQDRIYVNPDCEVDSLRTGDLIIVFCDEDQTATFKRIIIEPDNMYLEALNPAFRKDRKMSLKNGCRLIGKVVGMHRYM
jgi:SOS-response transcriptional repressor LexA